MGSKLSDRRGRSAAERISEIVEGWYLSEPLLFAAWTRHEVLPTSRVQNIRVGHGKIQYNAAFVDSLRVGDLRLVLRFEAVRILLSHPYRRRGPDPATSYLASNVAVQECLRTTLPMPRARDLWDNDEHDGQYYEYYYSRLASGSSPPPNPPPDPPPDDSTPEPDASGRDDEIDRDSERDPNDTTEANNPPTNHSEQPSSTDPLDRYADASASGPSNAADWTDDDLMADEIRGLIQDASATDGWGSLGGSTRTSLIATLRPRVDYRSILRAFRTSILSNERRLTRSRPSRRYGWQYMGSRYQWTTRLLFAVDVSGSMTDEDLQNGFSVINQFFRYGIRQIDVLWFDTEIRGGPETFRHAKRQVTITGRGGTNFKPVLDHIDRDRSYDGLIVFTDGCAPAPPPPANRSTRILWLFNDAAPHQQMRRPLSRLGQTTSIRPAAK